MFRKASPYSFPRDGGVGAVLHSNLARLASTWMDEYKGFFPHLISCDKYWACDDGVAELRTCGNGLAFLDTDEVRLISSWS